MIKKEEMMKDQQIQETKGNHETLREDDGKYVKGYGRGKTQKQQAFVHAWKRREMKEENMKTMKLESDQ